MAVVLVDEGDTSVGNGVVDTERARTVVTDRRIVPDSLVEAVIVVVFVFEQRDPLGARAVEDEFGVVLGVATLLTRGEPTV